MKIAILACMIVAASAFKGPKFTIDVSDPSLPNGVGSLNLEGEYERELVENVNAGLKYNYNSNRGLPTSLWVSTSADIDDDTTLEARAEYNVEQKSTAIEAKLNRGDDSIATDFDTESNQVGPVKISKSFDLDGRKVTLRPEINVQDRTGEIEIEADVDGDNTTALLTLNQADESASLEVTHKLDDANSISPKIDMKSGDISVRLNRDLGDSGAIEVEANRNNIDWELNESDWTVAGNIPLEDSGKSSVSFKRSFEL